MPTCWRRAEHRPRAGRRRAARGRRGVAGRHGAGAHRRRRRDRHTLDPATIESLVDLDVRQGSVRDLRADQVAVSAGYAEDHHLTLGDPVTVGYGDGVTERPRVGAIYGTSTVLDSTVAPIWRSSSR
jgi:hypothetical protein